MRGIVESFTSIVMMLKGGETINHFKVPLQCNLYSTYTAPGVFQLLRKRIPSFKESFMIPLTSMAPARRRMFGIALKQSTNLKAESDSFAGIREPLLCERKIHEIWHSLKIVSYTTIIHAVFASITACRSVNSR